MASRIENLSLRSFLTNPTKISNALRQTRAPLRSDAVSCYFDPLLEADASAAQRIGRQRTIRKFTLAAEARENGQMPSGLAPRMQSSAAESQSPSM